MGLEMRDECERCGDNLEENDECYICVYECTWCPDCTNEMDYVCPNCSGELVRRPQPPAAS